MIRAHIDNGNLMILDKREWELFKQANEGKKVIVELTEYEEHKRTVYMNRYYWGVIIKMITVALNELGWEYEKDHTHEFLREQFLTDVIVNKITGKQRTILLSTSNLSVKKFGEYMERCIKFASEELDFMIPIPKMF